MLGFNGLRHGGARIVCTGAHIQRHTPCATGYRAFDNGAALGWRYGGRLAGGSENDQRVRFRIDLPVDQLFQAVIIHARAAKGRYQRRAAAVKQISQHKPFLPDHLLERIAPWGILLPNRRGMPPA